MFWNQDCSTEFNKDVENKDKALILFEKEGNDTYKATFINDYKVMAQQEFNIRKIIETISATGLIFDPDNQKNLYLIEFQIRMKELRIYGNDLAKVQVH